jgi:ABC-type nitrate/sulfonate/bicarbonate transport system ATPase subunit
MIRIKDIWKRFNNNLVLGGISLNIQNDTIVSIIGKSGCGKSTLLNLIAGLLKAEEGNIYLSNSELSYLTQKPTLLSYRNSYENAILGLELRNDTDCKSRKEIENLFALFGLEHTLYKYPNELSGGMKQRIGIIQTILIDSEIYLLDEPFTAIDRNTLVKIENYIWNLLKKKGAIAIFVNHDLEQAISFGDRVIILSSNPGTIVYDQSFSSDYSKLSPSERKDSPFYSKYLLDIVKKFSES